MNYELCKKLKDAGFPQNTKYFVRKYSLANEPLEFRRPPEGVQVCALSGKIEWEVAVPTLSELIEACGDEFGSLYRVLLMKGSKLIRKIWVARALKDQDELDYWVYPKYETPIEAVTNLWLKLNEKPSL